jgi:hypothetical protein
MLSSLAESWIQRVCGRYLKNFSSDNVNVSIGGTISTIAERPTKTFANCFIIFIIYLIVLVL